MSERKIVMVANDTKGALVLPAVGRWGTIAIKPGLISLDEEHWKLIKERIQPPPKPDPLSLAYQMGKFGLAEDIQKAKAEVLCELGKEEPEEKADDTKDLKPKKKRGRPKKEDK